MKFRLNLKKWNESRQEAETNIRKIKDALATPGHQGTTTEWLTLFDLQTVATTLYMLRAETRGEGRLHSTHEVTYKTTGNAIDGYVTEKIVVPVTREEQRKRIAPLMPGLEAQPDANGEVGYFCVCPEKPIASVTVPA